MEPSTDPSASCPESRGPATPPPSMAWLSSARTFRMVERQVWPQAGGPALGVPLGHLVDHSPHCRRAALSQGCRVSLLLCVMQHPGAIGKSAGVIGSCLQWGNIIAALTLLTRCWESVKHKWPGEQRKTQKTNGELLGCFRSHL